MATWDNVVYTTQGLNLMAKLQTGAALEITRAIGSDGHVSADALPSLTEITAKQTLTLSDAIYKGNGQALLPVTLYNRGLTEGYPLRQIGIYATDPDDGEVLMLVAQSETPDTIPTELASPDFVVNFSFHIALGNAGRINVTYSLTDMVTRADLAAVSTDLRADLAATNTELANKANISALGKPKAIAIPGISGATTGGNIGWAYKNAFGEVSLGIWADLAEPVNSIEYRTIGMLPLGYRPSPYESLQSVVQLRGSESGLEVGFLSVGSSGKIEVARALGSTANGLNMVRGQINFYAS